MIPKTQRYSEMLGNCEEITPEGEKGSGVGQPDQPDTSSSNPDRRQEIKNPHPWFVRCMDKDCQVNYKEYGPNSPTKCRQCGSKSLSYT